MGQCILGVASPALASIGALLVSAVHESTSEQKGNNELVRVGYDCSVRMKIDEDFKWKLIMIMLIIEVNNPASLLMKEIYFSHIPQLFLEISFCSQFILQR
jgi:hypothetical protein